MDVNCNDIPDAAMTLAVAALVAGGTTTIRDVYSWRVKETERMKVGRGWGGWGGVEVGVGGGGG